jgi:phage tail-like protein
MATENQYPLPSFHFSVSWKDNETVPFSEVSGLNVEITPIEYRDGDDKTYTTLKMPGMKKYGNISLKRGTLKSDNSFFEWWNTAALNTIERRTVTISLLNEKHEPVVTWKVNNAFPIKVDGGSLNAKNNEVLLESIELVHEGLTIEHPAK